MLVLLLGATIAVTNGARLALRDPPIEIAELIKGAAARGERGIVQANADEVRRNIRRASSSPVAVPIVVDAQDCEKKAAKVEIKRLD